MMNNYFLDGRTMLLVKSFYLKQTIPQQSIHLHNSSLLPVWNSDPLRSTGMVEAQFLYGPQLQTITEPSATDHTYFTKLNFGMIHAANNIPHFM